MGLSQALQSAISGLINHQTAMDNIGNNLANVNTVAFKKGVFQFSTLLEQTLQGGTTADAQTGRGPINPIAIGLGTQTSSITKNYNQGSLNHTGNNRDMAIDGNGYFVLRQGNSNVYTRDGSFYLGNDGTLLGSSGLQVQGVMAEEGSIPDSGVIEDIVIPIGQTGGARETTEISFTGNLNKDQEVATGTLLTTAAVDPGLADYFNSPVNNTDTTWSIMPAAVLAGEQPMINGGSVWTTAGLGVVGALPGTYAAASGATDLADVYYYNGDSWTQPFQGISEDDEITISFRKGGRLQEATFVYNSEVAAPSNTLEHFMTFLTGGIDNYSDVTDISTIEADASRLNGGAMGTVKIAGRVSTAHTDTAAIPNTGTSSYDSPPETAGGFTRGISNTVDYDGDNILDAANSFNYSVVSNLGSENAISNIEISFNNVKYTDMFQADSQYQVVQGGSSTTNMVVYDSVGAPKQVTMQLSLVDRDTNFSTWRWVADCEDDTDADFQFNNNVPVAGISTNVHVGTGLIRFDKEGNFVDGTEYSETGGIEITLEDQGVNSPLKISLVNGLIVSGTQDLDFSAMTQLATESDFNLKGQDGTAPGTLDEFTVTPDGVIQGIFSNGVVEEVGRLVLALIPNENGLIQAGDNIYYVGPASGAAQIDFAGIGGRGSVNASQLEGSNVDMSQEFTELIKIERGFQANARVITTSDEMLQELVNLKR